MVLLPIMDNLLYNIQRQGKISFYVRIFPSIPYLTLRVTFKSDDRRAHIPFISMHGDLRRISTAKKQRSLELQQHSFPTTSALFST